MMETLAENRGAATTQPAIEHGRVDAAEIDGMPGVAVLQVLQIRIRAMQAALHALGKLPQSFPPSLRDVPR